MAQRRMFSKKVVCTSKFIQMPDSARSLYYHFGMEADDDGFVEYYMIMRMLGSNIDDLRILEAKKYVHVFDDKVLLILHWPVNNYLQTDRKERSQYLDVYYKELAELSEQSNNLQLNFEPKKICIQNVYTGKDSIGKYRLYTPPISPPNKINVDKVWTDMILPLTGKYSKSTIDDFTDHWRQKTTEGKELWQVQRAFDIERRLSRWERKSQRIDFERQTRRNTTPINF